MKKNDFIELCRFLACIFIFSYHANGIFKSGWIFVEYFFMLSGYFLMKHWWRRKDEISEPGKYPITYTLKKFARFWPYVIIALLGNTYLIICQYHLHGTQIIKWILHLPANMLLLNGTGVVPEGVAVTDTLSTSLMMVPPLWYLAAMFVAIPIVLYLLEYGWKKIGYWLITFLPFILYGNMIIRDGTIDGWHHDMMEFFTLDSRALAGLLLGAGIFVAAEKLRSKKFTVAGKTLMTIVELVCLICTIFLGTMPDMPYEILVILLFAVSLIATCSGQSLTSGIHCRVFSFLGGVSLPVYCFHWVVLIRLQIYGLDPSVDKDRWTIMGVTLVISVIVYLIVELSRKGCRKGWKKFSGLFVKTE